MDGECRNNKPKDKRQIIKELAENKVIETIIGNLVQVDEDERDLIQDLYFDLLQKDEELIVDLYVSGQLQFYLTRCCVNQVRSKNSPYYYKYKKTNLNKVNLDDVKDKI